MLDVRLLGQFSVTLDGRPVIIAGRPAQLLLAYLILNAGSPHPREVLADRLWPESSAANARANLRHALWQLRKALEPDGDDRPGYLTGDPHEIGFNHASAYTLDVDRLECERPAGSTAELLAATEAYRGELLPGFYEPWVVLERERLLAVFEQCMSRLLNRLTLEQRWDDVVFWAERWIALGESPEPAYRALMRAYAARGDSGRVIATFRRCRESLWDGLGVEPSPETKRLAEELARSGTLLAGLPPKLARGEPEGGSGGPPSGERLAAVMTQADIERQRADLYLHAAQRSNRLALGALLGLAAAVGVIVALRRR